MNIYIGEPKTITVSDMQGPCPDGFHVPLKTEWQAIYDVGVSLGAWSSSNGTGISTYLKLPKAGNRDGDSNAYQINTWGMYWSSSPTRNSSYACNFSFISNLIQPESSDYYYKGCYVRGIKDYPVVPTSSWAMLYGTSIESGGIFHNATNGLISISSDGSTWYTLMDKNLGATTVYNNGDTLSDANCGNVFQWGNNYPFPGTLSYDGITTSSTKVNANTYGPGNYYESSTWITSNPWDSSNNTNLRGGVSQGISTKTEYQEVQNIYLGEYVPDFATQGPCPHGFHVPLQTEWEGLKTIMDGLGLTTGDSWRINLHIPFSGARYYYDSSMWGANSFVYYWSSTPYITTQYNAYAIQISSGINIVQYNRGYGFPIRPFYKEFITPTSSWVVIQGTLGSAGIFWNQTDGLISITSDGTTGYTITDKNLGATTVYNNGDTLTQDNMGNMYQWGNNYGFPSTGTISNTSTTTVNASAYGPGNYYSSDMFIKETGYWDSSNNTNLRGGVDGNVPVS